MFTLIFLPMSTPARYVPMPRHYGLGGFMNIVGQKTNLAPAQVKRVPDECCALVLKRTDACCALVLKRSDAGLCILMPPELSLRLKKRTQAPARPRGITTSSIGTWRRKYTIINNKIKKAPVHGREVAAPAKDFRLNPPPPSPIVLD